MLDRSVPIRAGSISLIHRESLSKFRFSSVVFPQMKVLKSQDILALGFMTFALFVGAGNIIFPPIVGLQSGPHVWMAALGFLITAVGLPVVTVIALAKVGGGMDALSSPIGKALSELTGWAVK